MKLKAPSYPVLAGVAYTVFAFFGLATWYPLLFVAVPLGTSTIQTVQDLLAIEPGGKLLGLHTLISLGAAVFATFLLVRPVANRRSSLFATVAATVFALATLALYQSDTALLPWVAAACLAWNHVKPQTGRGEA